MKYARASGVAALVGLFALSAVACDRSAPSAKDTAPVTSWKDSGSISQGSISQGSIAQWGGDGRYLAQNYTDAGYGMPNPQPGSPISPSREAGIAPPAPSPTVPNVPNAPPAPAPLPRTPSSPTSPSSPSSPPSQTNPSPTNP